MDRDKEIEYIYVLKAYAIFSVICAHTSSTPIGAYSYISSILSNIGTIGVIMFFAISGYLFYNNKDKFSSFLIKKKSILIPWIFCGVLVYSATQILGSKSEILSIKNMILFLLGYQTYLYYISILMISYITFFKLKNYNYILVLSMVVTTISIWLTGAHKLNLIQPYLNPFNWFGFFALGILVKKKTGIEKVIKYCTKYWIPIIVVFSLFITVSAMNKIEGYYWTAFSIPIEITGFMTIIILSHLGFSNNKLIYFIGKQSFAIYLLHMPVAGIINIFFNKNYLVSFSILKPLVVISIMTLILYIISKVAKKIKLDNTIFYLIGMR